MADEPRRVSTRRAVLSYDQLGRLTKESGFEWPDLLIKDYQGIIQDFAFTADEIDDLEVRVAANEVAIAALEVRVEALEIRVVALEYKVFSTVNIDSDTTLEEFKMAMCINIIPIDVTLKLEPLTNDEVHIKRTNAEVNIIGLIDGIADLTLNVLNYSVHLVYDGTSWRTI